jgi:hypothetical protein
MQTVDCWRWFVTITPVTPLVFLYSTIAITLGAAGMQGFLRASERRKLRRLALEWKMNYCANDRFNLTDRLAAQLPIPGAADVDVSDIIYGSEGDGHRFLLTAEYTTGVVQAKKQNWS